MATRTDRIGRRTFGRVDEHSRGGQKGVLPAVDDLGLQGTDQVLTSEGLEGLKLATHAALEEMRTRMSQALSQISNAVGSSRTEPNRFGGKLVKAAGVPKDNEVAVFVSENRIEGDSRLTFDSDTTPALFTVGAKFLAEGLATFDNPVTFNDSVLFGDIEDKTLFSDAITASDAVHIRVAAQAGGTDDLVTLNSGSEGKLVVIRPDGTDVITVKHETGNISLFGGTDTVLNGDTDSITLLHDDSNWKQIGGVV